VVATPPNPPLTLVGARRLTRDPLTWQGSTDDGSIVPCLRCVDAPCERTTPEVALDLCPVDALSVAHAPGGVTVGHHCIQCGLCVLRCPVGAVAFSADGARVTLPADAAVDAVETDADSFAAWRRGFATAPVLDATAREALVDRLWSNAAGHRQREYYRLGASLFRGLGIPASLSHAGDNASRVDLVLDDAVDPIAVEIKSATEVGAINVKSIQQALENKLTLARRQGHGTLTSTSTLVVGHAYPADRTGIAELIDAIHGAFGVNVGIISLRSLYARFVDLSLGGQGLTRSALTGLRGAL